jgi:hypothetical protein
MRAILVCGAIVLTCPILGSEPDGSIQKRFKSDHYTVTWGKPHAVDSTAELEIGDGNGHGFTLGWLRFRPGRDGVEVLSVEFNERVTAPEKPAVAVKLARMKPDAYSALLRDLATVDAAKLKPAEDVSNGGSFSDFWVHARITAGEKATLDVDWAGYDRARAEVENAKPRVAVDLAREAVKGLAFKDHAPTDQERAWASEKFTRDWKKFKSLEFHWWVRERYIQIIGVVGDRAALLTLQGILTNNPPKDRLPDASEVRSVTYALTAVGRLTKADVWGPRGEDGDVDAARQKALGLLRDRK